MAKRFTCGWYRLSDRFRPRKIVGRDRAIGAVLPRGVADASVGIGIDEEKRNLGCFAMETVSS